MPKIKSKPLPPFSEGDVKRFLPRVQQNGPEECWPWKGARDGAYGAFTVRDFRKGYKHVRHLLPSRVAYFIAFGEDPHPFLVCHSCDHGWCCNPRHLWKGTDSDNIHDMLDKGRHIQIGKRGALCHFAKLTEKQVEQIRGMQGSGISQKKMGAMFGVAQATIGRILLGRSWR